MGTARGAEMVFPTAARERSDCVVSVPGFIAGAKQGRRREDGVERVRGARQRQIQHQEDWPWSAHFLTLDKRI